MILISRLICYHNQKFVFRENQRVQICFKISIMLSNSYSNKNCDTFNSWGNRKCCFCKTTNYLIRRAFFFRNVIWFKIYKYGLMSNCSTWLNTAYWGKWKRNLIRILMKKKWKLEKHFSSEWWCNSEYINRVNYNGRK